MLRLGDKVQKNINWTDDEPSKRGAPKKNRETAEGTVVYIHPRRRYYTLEFAFSGGKYRECYSF